MTQASPAGAAPAAKSDAAAAPAQWSGEIPKLSPEALIDAGFHYGHRTSRWNPRMRRYIRDKRNGIHIINLKESLRGLIRAKHFLRNLCSTGVKVCFVGTKKQAKDIIELEAKRAGQAFVSERWLGGTLTNFATIRRRLARLEKLEALEAGPDFARMPKKMQAVVLREKRKIFNNLQGLRTLDKVPAALVVVDANAETIAIKEAGKLDVPVVAIVDTDSSPDLVDIVIPGNDDSVRGLQIILHELADACIEGKKMHEAGQGMKLKLDLEIRAFDEYGTPHKERGEGERPGRGERGGDRGTRGPRQGATRGPRGPRGPRSEQQTAATEEATKEAVETAEAQSAKAASAPVVRTKPRAAKKDAPKAEPKVDAEAKEPKKE